MFDSIRSECGVAAAVVIAALVLLEWGSQSFAQVAGTQGSSLTTRGLAQDAFLNKTLYCVPSRMASNIASDGAIGVNRNIDSGHRLYIEEQRYGGDLVQTGLVTGDDSLVQLGLKVIAWGFTQQAPDGSFPGTGDPFHSVSMFVEGTARALLSLHETGKKKYSDDIDKLSPKLVAAARWLENPDVQRVGQGHDAPYTHRRWILAAALGETSKLAGNPLMAANAKSYADAGLSLQRSDGVNPEKGGYDVSYQAVGILEAERYLVACDVREERARVRRMIELASDWELSMIGDDGQITVGDSTRVGNEKSRSGKVKHVNIKELLQALAYATKISGDQKYLSKAVLVARARGWY